MRLIHEINQVPESIRRLIDIYPIDVSLYQHRCFIEVAGNIIGEINYSVAEKKLDFSLRILPEMQQMGFGRTAFEMLYQEIIKHDELTSYKVKKTVVFEEGKPFLNRFNFGYNQETDEYEYFIYSEEDIAMINETNEALMKTLTSTITMDEFIAKLDDRLFIDNLDPVFIYLKGLGNIDYNSVDANQIDTYMTSMIEACGTDDLEVTNNMDKIKYFIQLLDSEEIDRLLWIVHQLSYFSVYRLTAQLYYGIELDFDNLQEKESISFHPDFPGAYFNPFDALINGLVILQEHINESENYGYFIPHLEKLKIRASQDDVKGLIDLLDIYQIDTLEEPDIINMIIDPAYENKSGKVIAYLEKTFISYYSDLYINFSIAKALIRSMDKEYAFATWERLYPEETLFNWGLLAIDQEKDYFIHYIKDEIELEHLRNSTNIELFNEHLDNFEYALEKGVIDMNTFYKGKGHNFFTFVLEEGSKEMIDLCIRYGADLYIDLFGSDKKRGLKQFTKVLHNPMSESIEYVIDTISDQFEENITDIIDVAAYSDNVEQLMLLVSSHPQAVSKLKEKQARYLVNAIKEKQRHMFVYLIRYHYGFNAKTNDQSVLFNVIRMKDNRLLDFLLSSNETKLDIKNRFGSRPIIHAISHNNVYAVEALHKKGVLIEDGKGISKVRVPFVNKNKYPEMYELVKRIAPTGAARKDTIEIVLLLILFFVLLFVLIFVL